jgi:proline iminopeptidase
MPFSVQGEYMKRRSFLGRSAASLIAAGLSNARVGLCDVPPRTQQDELNPAGIRTAGIRMVPVVNGKYKVWTKKLGSGSIKVLLLHGGPGFSHEYLEAMESFLPQAGIEMYLHVGRNTH